MQRFAVNLPPYKTSSLRPSRESQARHWVMAQGNETNQKAIEQYTHKEKQRRTIRLSVLWMPHPTP